MESEQAQQPWLPGQLLRLFRALSTHLYQIQRSMKFLALRGGVLLLPCRSVHCSLHVYCWQPHKKPALSSFSYAASTEEPEHKNKMQLALCRGTLVYEDA